MIEQQVEAYLARWGNGASYGGNERANLQMFVTELCTLLELPHPEPAGSQHNKNAYVFERRVTEFFADGGQTVRQLDLYRRGCFILEGKDTGKKTGSSGWDAAIDKARKQAENYARALPVEEGRPPFIIVVDVGKSFALYAEFSRSGGNYVAFPDARRHKIPLEKLRDAEVRELLRTLWLDPLSLDPTRHAGKVTRTIADRLATLAKSLEESGHAAEAVAGFLMRCLFTMFAEDVELLPSQSFAHLLERLKNKPSSFCNQLRSLWQTMNTGGFAPALDAQLLKFNGGLFAEATVIELNAAQIELLAEAAKADWRYVEPAIFGTLLERALNPRERHKLGAHYTPRAYVERLVLPTIIDPLRAEWADVQATALAYQQQAKDEAAIAELRAFHRRLCEIRVLDPACGSGNFLYVTLEHMKRLEGEVLEVLGSFIKSGSFEMEGLTVDPHQFLGIEINPRAAKIAEMVLWIGYLQWHFRTYGNVNPPEPVLRDFKNIENRDALITYESCQRLTDATGQPLTRWDGQTYKTSPITGDPIPDESAQIEQFRYIKPKKAKWPKADYIIGNPPFIGNKRMRITLSDTYVDALRASYPEIPESADFVMFWWHIAGEKVTLNETARFGFITTNSIRQEFNRRIIENLFQKETLGIDFAIPDHPWIDSADGAQVRIAMTIACNKNVKLHNTVANVINETLTEDEIEISFKTQKGFIHPNLRIGANLTNLTILESNSSLANRGMIPHGEGFLITKDLIGALDNGALLKPYRNGRDLTTAPRHVFVIDTHGLTEAELRKKYPQTWQHLYNTVKPDRDINKRKSVRENWWLFGEPRKVLRSVHQNIKRYVATVQTAKHRFFQFLEVDILPDDKLIAIGLEDAFYLGVLSSRLHVYWALATGSTLEDRPVYNKAICFDAFPFPVSTPEQQKIIRELAEQIDAHRKKQQATYPELTLTGIYNVLEKIRANDTLEERDKTIHNQGLVSILLELHDKLDRAVFDAYGWADLAEKLVGLPGATTPLPNKSEFQSEAEEVLLCRLVELNAQRAAEETRGEIRWLRPEYQNPNAVIAPTQVEAEFDFGHDKTASKTKKQTWPKDMREQISVLRNTLGNESMALEEIIMRFKTPKTTAPLIISALAALVEMGQVEKQAERFRFLG